jgi:hypothetical protein
VEKNQEYFIFSETEQKNWNIPAKWPISNAHGLIDKIANRIGYLRYGGNETSWSNAERGQVQNNRELGRKLLDEAIVLIEKIGPECIEDDCSSLDSFEK